MNRSSDPSPGQAKAKKMGLALFFLLGILLAAQTAYFVLIFAGIKGKEPQPPVDVIWVFGGEKGRLETGLKLFRDTKAAALLISDFGRARPFYERKGVDLSAPPIFFLDAEDTLENAIVCADFSRRMGWERVILVTSWYHAPRAALLCRLYGAGRLGSFQVVASGSISSKWWKKRYFWMEWPKFWGSLAKAAIRRDKAEERADGRRESPSSPGSVFGI